MQIHKVPADLQILCIDLVRRTLRMGFHRVRRLYHGSCLLLQVKRHFRGNLRILLRLLLGLVGWEGLKVGRCAGYVPLRVV